MKSEKSNICRRFVFFRGKLGAIQVDFPAWLIISLIVGAVAIVGIFILKGKLSGGIEFIKNMLG